VGIRAAQLVSKVVVTWQDSASKSATNHTAKRYAHPYNDSIK